MIVRRGGPTLVFRVRFSTEPALMMRSNSKQPFWFTGDMTPALSASACACACAWMLDRRGCAGGLSFMGEGAGARVTGIGLAASAMAAGSLHQAAGGRRASGTWQAGRTVAAARVLLLLLLLSWLYSRCYDGSDADRHRRATGGRHGRGRLGLSRSTMASRGGQRYICGAPARLSRQSGEVKQRPGSGSPLEAGLLLVAYWWHGSGCPRLANGWLP